DERDARAELDLRGADLHKLFSRVVTRNARDRPEQPGTGVLEAVQGAGEGLGGVGDRRHANEHTRVAVKLLFRNAVNVAATMTRQLVREDVAVLGLRQEEQGDQCGNRRRDRWKP